MRSFSLDAGARPMAPPRAAYTSFIPFGRPAIRPYFFFSICCIFTMKNFLSTLKNKVNALAVRVHSAAVCAQTTVTNDAGDFYISDGVKVIIAVVLGALLLAAMTLIFNNTVIPRITEEINSLFA